MTQETPIVAPLPSETEKIIHIPLAAAPAPPLSGTVDAEQVRAAEALFTAREQESNDAAGLMAMWTGAMLLHDAALDAVRKRAREVEEEEKPKADS